MIEPQKFPEPTEVLFRGLDDIDEYNSFFSDPLAKLISHLDVIYIVAIVLSLLAIIFTYDAVCGEREDGTLKLLHTNRISRATILLGKLVGAWVAIGVPFLAVFLFAAILGSFVGGMTISAAVLIELGVICLASLLYIGFFLCTGLFVSSLVRHSGTSILILLFIWVLFVLVAPNASPIIASQISPLPSVGAAEREIRMLVTDYADRRRNEEIDKMRKEIWQEYGVPDSIEWFNREEFVQIGWSAERIDEMFAIARERLEETMNRVRQEQNDKAQAIRDELNRKIEAQSSLAGLISLSSPMPPFIYLATDTAGLGLRGEEHFSQESGNFYQQMGEYVRQRTAELQRELGRQIHFEEHIDLSTRPRFQHVQEPIGDRVISALPYLGHLVISLLVALILAVVAYIRYDVR